MWYLFIAFIEKTLESTISKKKINDNGNNHVEDFKIYGIKKWSADKH